MKDYDKAQELLDKIPELIDKKKIGGKDLPTEVFIKKKRASYLFMLGERVLTRARFSGFLEGEAEEHDRNRSGLRSCR